MAADRNTTMSRLMIKRAKNSVMINVNTSNYRELANQIRNLV